MTNLSNNEIEAHIKRPHKKQGFVDSKVPRIIVKAGRRSGKTIGASVKAVRHFLDGGRVLYGAPTQDQVESFWWEVTQALYDPIQQGIFYKNETKHLIELPNSKQRIRAKTCWNADTLRGDWADLLILDEWQLMNEGAWELVGAPMLLDNDGQALFIFTPPSLHSSRLDCFWFFSARVIVFMPAPSSTGLISCTFNFFKNRTWRPSCSPLLSSSTS